jgi:hypothetical protein
LLRSQLLLLVIDEDGWRRLALLEDVEGKLDQTPISTGRNSATFPAGDLPGLLGKSRNPPMKC